MHTTAQAKKIKQLEAKLLCLYVGCDPLVVLATDPHRHWLTVQPSIGRTPFCHVINHAVNQKLKFCRGDPLLVQVSVDRTTVDRLCWQTWGDFGVRIHG